MRRKGFSQIMNIVIAIALLALVTILLVTVDQQVFGRLKSFSIPIIDGFGGGL